MASTAGYSEVLGLRRWRHVRGWNQTQLAAQVGVSVQTISEWETGRRKPRFHHLQTLTRIFDQPIDVLFPSQAAA